MDIIRIEGREVIKCVHCNGTGTCQKPGYVTRQQLVSGEMAEGGILSCPKCGEGVFRPATPRGFFLRTFDYPKSTDMVWPVCGVCGGKGHTIIQ